MSWKHAPRIVQWDITHLCNQQCLHCRATNLSSIKDDINFEQIKLILEKINQLCPSAFLVIAGGEPLLRPDLREILSYVNQKYSGLKIEILTNGTLINKRNIKWLVKYARGINISLDGASAKVHDAMRGKGAFAQTVRGIKIALAADAQVAVRMTYLQQAEDEAERLLYFLAELGVSFFNFRYFVPVGRASQAAINAIQNKRLSEKIWQLGQELNIKIGFSDPFSELLINQDKRAEVDSDQGLLCGRAVAGCSIAFDLLYLDPEGIVKLCPYFPALVADAKKVNLNSLWFTGKSFTSFRRYRSLLKGKCAKCKYKFACGGCRGAAWANGTDCFLAEDPRCWHGL